MTTMDTRRRRVASICVCAALALTFAAAPLASADGTGPVVSVRGGAVRGAAVPGADAFLGLPYAAPPTGDLRWRPPRRPAAWRGVRDATVFAPSCPQPHRGNLSFPPGPISEDCLYLNVYTPAVGRSQGAGRPVLVWIHGGGFTEDAARNYDGSKLAATGAVVVTINYRLGILGFLAHPALASRPGGPAGNYGLMDQEAALRWVRGNISQFGGDPHDVTIAGESAGGVAVLAHLVSRRSRGLFQRAIVESGAFALDQESLADAEAAGEAFAAQPAVGCADQSASCLRRVPSQDLVDHFPTFAIPGVVDGAVLREPIGNALASGQFAHVPVLNGINHNEELIFVAGLGLAVSGGTFVPVPQPLTAASYENAIAQVLGATPGRAAAIAAEYPLDAYGSVPALALSTLVSDANFACPALQVDRWTSRRGPTFAYQFNDDAAPRIFAGPHFPPIATHASEYQYLFDLPNAPFPGTFTTGQEALAATMRSAWSSFSAAGDPSSEGLQWPAFDAGTRVMSLIAPQPHVDSSFASEHHCAFWGGA